MDPNTFPTKGNLILAKNSLKLAHMGYELMDKKRNILIRELMGLIDEAKDIQRQIDVTFREAYAALRTWRSVSPTYRPCPIPFRWRNLSGSRQGVSWAWKFRW